MTAPKIVLIAEDTPSGHRLAYVRLLTRFALDSGFRVVWALPTTATETTEYVEHLADLRPRVQVAPLSQGINPLRELESVSRRSAADLTVVPDADSWLESVALRGWQGKGELRLLVMRPSAPGSNAIARSFKTWAKRLLSILARSRRAVAVYSLASAVDDRPGRYAAPDPVELSIDDHAVERIRESWQLDRTRYWFAVVGAITERKNVPLIMDAITASGISNPGLLIAGKVDAATLAGIEAKAEGFRARGSRLSVVDRTLSDQELDAAVCAADCLVLAHSNEGPSGILGKAVVAGTPVAAAGAKSLRHDALRAPSAVRWSALDVSSLGSLLRATHANSDGETRPLRHESVGARVFCERMLC